MLFLKFILYEGTKKPIVWWIDLLKQFFPQVWSRGLPQNYLKGFQNANFYASPHICQTRIRYWGLKPRNMSFTFSPGDVYDNCIKGIPANRQCSQFKCS